ncbi:MAG: LysR family transcriptional regulator, partial [Oscillospiraceae bacterium]|nr:LysR family transcriptional regulator [Oscillospiraceae bacterium]
MDLEKYKALLTAIDEGSLSAAAKKLDYTPSGISRMITALEEENGFRLLKRKHEGVIPTEECNLML